jgi:hypothetical protein
MLLRPSLFLGLLGTAILSLANSPASAKTVELQPHPLNDPAPVNCPKKVMAYETPKPYREGGFETDGMVDLSAIATQITIGSVDPFSVTWIGTLKPQFKNCQAAAGMTTLDGQPFSEHSYLRLRLLKGKVYFILDMTGLRDANDYTTVILKKDIVKGNPRWTWGGTD